MVVCVSEKDAETTLQTLSEMGETAWRLGQIEAVAAGEQTGVVINGSLA
jgi:phosphoribosylaminoimidazole (AIR) synthetase